MTIPVVWGAMILFAILLGIVLWWIARNIPTLLSRLFTTAFVLTCLAVGLWTTYLLLRG